MLTGHRIIYGRSNVADCRYRFGKTSQRRLQAIDIAYKMQKIRDSNTSTGALPAISVSIDRPVIPPRSFASLTTWHLPCRPAESRRSYGRTHSVKMGKVHIIIDAGKLHRRRLPYSWFALFLFYASLQDRHVLFDDDELP